MATPEHRTGDLFRAPDADALAHGCNCAGAMGRGVAVEFRRRWPDMYREYRARCRDGSFTPGGVLPWRTDEGRVVYNLGTQRHWRSPAELPAVVTAVTGMLRHAEEHGVRRIAMPRIGAGLGGLEWDDVEAALAPALAGSPVAVVVYQLPDG